MSRSRQAYRTGRDALNPEEITRLLQSARSFQDEALLRLAIETGVRREDLVAVRVEGLDLEAGELTYFETKKDRTRTATIGPETVEVLRRYIGTLPRGARWLFPSREGGKGHLAGRTAWNALQWALKRAGLRPRPFHALRATCVKLAQHRGWTPEQVSEQTGDTIRVIQQHYSTPSRDEMRAVTRDKPLLGGVS